MNKKALVSDWVYSKVGCKLCSGQHRCLPAEQIWFAPAPPAVLDTFLYPHERRMRFHNPSHCLVSKEYAPASDMPLEQTP